MNKRNIKYKIAEWIELRKIISFLSLSEIDQSFVKPLSERDISIRERVRQKYDIGEWIIATDGYSVVGCVAVIPKDNELEISTFAVDHKYRGRGIGTRLLDESIRLGYQNYGHLEYIIMDSWEGNEAVECLMGKKGFDFYKSFEDKDKRPEGVKTFIYRRKNK